MNHNGGHVSRPRRTVLPSVSSRTLHHPSFMPLYVAADFAQHYQGNSHTDHHPITPAEFFYTDPTVSCGRRIPNMLSELMVFDCSQLNTPPPVMSACLAPPNCPDPFRSRPHPIRDLGSPTCIIRTIHPLVQPMQVVIQLTQEEDQAVTNLLQMRHQESLQSDEDLGGAQMGISSAAEPPVDLNPSPLTRKAGVGNALQQGRGWSDTELEAATLLSHLKEGDLLWGQNQHKTARTTPDPLLCRSTETQQKSDTLTALVPSHCTQNDISSTSFSCVWESAGFWSVNDRGAGDCCHPVLENNLVSSRSPRLPLRRLSDLEGDAVHALLSLADADVVQ